MGTTRRRQEKSFTGATVASGRKWPQSDYYNLLPHQNIESRRPTVWFCNGHWESDGVWYNGTASTPTCHRGKNFKEKYTEVELHPSSFKDRQMGIRAMEENILLIPRLIWITLQGPRFWEVTRSESKATVVQTSFDLLKDQTVIMSRGLGEQMAEWKDRKIAAYFRHKEWYVIMLNQKCTRILSFPIFPLKNEIVSTSERETISLLVNTTTSNKLGKVHNSAEINLSVP